MKKPFVALLLLVGAAAMVANLAFADDNLVQNELGNKLVNAKMVKELLGSRAARLVTSAGPDPDTVWLGKSYTNHTSVKNYWNLYIGNNLPTISDPANAIWDWDNSVGIQAPDSLHGWWPVRRAYGQTGGLTLPDDQRPWWAVDIGNQGNYVINQRSSAKRTFGVVGYWHADKGIGEGLAVTWSPITGTRSAWCGLREHGDNAVIDQVTKNAYNQTVLEYNSENGGGTGTSKRFPGYANQMDQMLYRDIALTGGSTLSISFNYRTRMSTAFTTTASTRTGWFHGDPLAVTSGNFISSTAAGTLAPRDSFQVFIGSPVNDAACVYSDGLTRPVYDHQRRWFSEVLRINEGGSVPYYEVTSAAGSNPADTTTFASYAGTASAGQISSILSSTGNPGRVRIVFRVKTNKNFADEDSRASGFTSLSRGAAMIDDVVLNGTTFGSFEAAEQSLSAVGDAAIDNRDTPFTTAVLNWKSTGKPPAIYFHTEDLNNLTYADLCGPPNSPARFCNIGGVVLTAGNHDDGEKSGDSRFTSDREVQHVFMSPTINLVDPTAQGVTSTIADVTEDYYIWYDMYAGMFNLNFSGNAWVYQQQAYPALQTGNLAKCWGEMRFPGFQIFNPEPQCFQDIEGLAGGQIFPVTSNPTGIPDSLRVGLGVNQQCFRFAVSLGCNSSDGAYFDNVVFGFIDEPVATQASAGNAISLGSVVGDIWMFDNDAFPVNESTGLPATAAFDTTSALIKTGINNAANTGNLLRFDIPGDSVVVRAANATVGALDDPAYKTVRVDMIFRILPGPGNYKISLGRHMSPGLVPDVGTLLQVPTNQSATVASGDASFWGQYIAAPGQFSAGTHNGNTKWDPLTWNSARCDTAELNFFPIAGAGTGLAATSTSTSFISTYHESDPKFATLGYNKFRCFVVDTTKAASSSPTVVNVLCDGTVPGYLTTVPQNRTGYDGSNVTKEFSKIIPDGQLTPGAHVQYFFRKSHSIDPLLSYAMLPDTNRITSQANEGSTDGHRWQQFGVLPDRWKDNAFGGDGSACVLYIDLNDRRGNERQWVSVMDSIGGTHAAKFGAHNGWHAPGTTSVGGLDVRTDMSVAVSGKNQQPGSTWDMYGVKASESLSTSAGAPGSRLANRGSMGFADGKTSFAGPTPEMLRQFYRVVAILSGDLTSGVLGPFVNRSQNDINLLNDYLVTVAGSARPRGIFVQGDGFAQSEAATAGDVPSHGTFLTDKLGVVFRNSSYQRFSGNANDCADLITTTNVTPSGDVYGVSNLCLWSNDVLQRNPAITETVDGSFYENVGVNGPYVAEVVKPSTAGRTWIALTSGYEIEHLLSRYCDTDNGRLAYYYYMLNHVFGTICTLTGAAGNTLDVPGNQHGAEFVNFMKVGNSVMRQGTSTVRFSVKSPGVVSVVLYDVTGRSIRTLAQRSFQAGEHSLTWDGTDDGGNRVARGVYFVRLRAKNGFEDKGRIIVAR